MPTEKIGSFYNSMDPEAYDEMVRMVNCTESDHILAKILEQPGLDASSEIYDVGRWVDASRRFVSYVSLRCIHFWRICSRM